MTIKNTIPSLLLVITAITLLTTSYAYAQSAEDNGDVDSGSFVESLAAVAPDGTWYRFQFGTTGSFGTSGPGDSHYSGAPSPPWTFSCPTGGLICWFSVTDGFLLGDEFEVFDFGASVGTTSSVPTDNTMQCDNNPEVCFAGGWSSAMINLGPGAHSITIQLTDSPFGGGAAFFKVDIHTAVGGEFVPMSTSALLLAGSQTSMSWMIPLVVAAAGFGLVIARKL